jgi:hypothetical protein
MRRLIVGRMPARPTLGLEAFSIEGVGDRTQRAALSVQLTDRSTF